MYRPISRLTGGALAATGAVLAIAAVAAVLLLSSSSPSSAATPGPSSGTGGWPTATPSASAASATTISVRRTSIGTILTGPGGETLYAFTRDARDHDVCARIPGCLAVWPLITERGSLSAGPGVHRSMLGTIIVQGARQVTYAGHPLYGFAQNSGPGDTSYVGTTEFGGRWPALSAAGRFVH